MKNKINRFNALFFICLLLISPFSVAQQGVSPDQSSPQDQEFMQDQESQYKNEFNNNPTPENFNNLPNPTAADLARASNPTLENFNHLSSNEQGAYLAGENL